MNNETTESELQRAEEMHQFIIDRIPGNYKNEARIKLFAGFISVAQSHHKAILVLTGGEGLTASAFALCRPLIEATCRGLYVAFNANDEQLRLLESGDNPYPGFDVLVAALDNMFATNGIFSQYGGSSWKILCDYTHCGIEQLFRQIGPDGSIQPSYESIDVQEILRCATSAFALATIPFLQVNEKEDAARAVSDQYMALYNLPKLKN